MAVYERISADLAQQVRSGLLVPGERLPSEGELAQRYGVTRMTIRHAVEQLVRDGLLFRRWGVGTFVAEERPAYRSFNRLQSFAEDIAAEGRALMTKVLIQEEVAAPPAVAEALALAQGAPVVRWERVRLLENRPVALQHSWVPLSICPLLPRLALVNGSLYATLAAEGGVKLGSAEQTVVPVAAGRPEAAALAVPRGTPLLRIERVTRDVNAQVVELARSWTVADLPIVMRLTRGER
jgi:GntR family transcriptional regulator